MASNRTALQCTADGADRELYGLICRVERMYDGIKHHRGHRVTDLHKSLMSLRDARSGIRMLMHADDRARTT